MCVIGIICIVARHQRSAFNVKLDHTYLQLPKLFYTTTLSYPHRDPKIFLLNHSLIRELHLDRKALSAEVLSAKICPKGTLSQAYAGHQFGHFTNLGDGRAVLIGEYTCSSGHIYDIHLKGVGRTAYSRDGDRKATLNSALREYIISEFMHRLHIPTTRGLAVVTTGENIVRDTEQPGAVMARVALSHIRIGTFQYAKAFGSKHDLMRLADYTIKRHNINAEENKYLHLLQYVVKVQAELVCKWMLVGFVHGVMNTDNVTVSGQTIDYGPCTFLDIYDPNTVFSAIDTERRYRYNNQKNITLWNLRKFANAIMELLDEDMVVARNIAKSALDEFLPTYNKAWLTGMRGKLGLYTEEDGDLQLAESLLDIMVKYKCDYTNTFRMLPDILSNIEGSDVREWLQRYKDRRIEG